tara:strand:+ start:131 stop:412 length:282 start_codon:yes stop_codon:yes gene_type:complete
METNTITKKAAFELLENSNGRIFSARFKKKDNTIRNITCRIEVKKGIKFVGRTFNPKEKNLLGVYDMQKQGFRFININTLQHIKLDKKEYKTI